MKIWLIGFVLILSVAICGTCAAPLSIEQAVGKAATATLPQVETAAAPLVQTAAAPLAESATVTPALQVPADIAQLANEAGMTDKAKAIFFFG